MNPQMIMMLMHALQQSGGQAGNIFTSLYNNPKDPYDAAEKHIKPWEQAGQNALTNYGTRLDQMSNGKDFMGNIMNDYKESPWAHNLQNQSMRAGQNAASASGMLGSTPFAQQMQQNANNISSEDQQKYYDNRMNINKDYMSGENNLLNYGQNASNSMGEMEYGKERASQMNNANIIQSILKLMMG